MSEKKDSLAVTANIVTPAVSPVEALKAWEDYELLKEKITTEGDIQIIQGKKFKKKSYWRKIATFFNLTVKIVREEFIELKNENAVYNFTCKAVAPNSRSVEGTGSCDLFEKATFSKKNDRYIQYNKFAKKWENAKPNTLHNTRSTAETRAYNRAVSNLVGGGEVSAEEVDKEQILATSGKATKAKSKKK